MKRKTFIGRIITIGTSKGIVIPFELIEDHNLKVSDILEIKFRIMGRTNPIGGK